MKIAIGCDHAGYDLKQLLVPRLSAEHEVFDMGAMGVESVDYPRFGRLVAEAVALGKVERGIVICGTGVGISIAANKVRGIRASVCHDPYSARMAVEHNDLNVLALGARVVGLELAWAVVSAYLGASFAGGRHQQRLDMIAELEKAG